LSDAAYQREWREKNKEHALAYQRQYMAEWRERNREKCRQYQAEWRKANREKDIEQGRQERRRLRLEVFLHYGNGELKCCKCGYDADHRALQLDHINNDGADNRRNARGSRTQAGTTFYRWLRKNGYPAGLQVLCANCNFLKEIDRRGADYSV
jgi:hypothetical protein